MNKLIIVIVSVGIVVGYLYYQNAQSYNLTQQQAQRNEASIENKVKCQKDGQQFYEKQQSRNEVGEFSYAVLGNQRYSYNKELNTCLIAWENIFSVRGTNHLSTHHITDVYSNIDVYVWEQLWNSKTIQFEDTQTSKGSEQEYNQMLQRYGLY